MLAECLLQRYGYHVHHLPTWFDHFLHGPTLLVLACFFFSSWWRLAKNTLRCFSYVIVQKSLRNIEKKIMSIIAQTVGMITLATTLTIAGYILHAHTSITRSLTIGFAITMLTLLSLTFCKKQTNAQTWYRTGIILGLLQAAALCIPGLSRFGFTYAGARWLGYQHRRSLQLSFLIFMPLMSAACLLHGWVSLITSSDAQAFFTLSIIITILTGTTLSTACLFFFDYVGQRNKAWVLGIYMIIPTILAWLTCSYTP